MSEEVIDTPDEEIPPLSELITLLSETAEAEGLSWGVMRAPHPNDPDMPYSAFIGQFRNDPDNSLTADAETPENAIFELVGAWEEGTRNSHFL